MPVELRKRKAPAPPPEPPAKKPTKAKTAAAAKTKEVKEAAPKPRGRPAKQAPSPAAEEDADEGASDELEVGKTISLDRFGGEIQKNDGTTTTLKTLVEESKAGVVIFTYPKASTPGCTKQACLFRDSYTPFTSSGLAIYGLSPDSPKANTTFQTKQNLPYPLLCDPKCTLLAAIDLKKAAGKATRGVFVVDKSGKVLAAQPGSPDGTLAVVKKIVESLGAGEQAEKAKEGEEKDEKVAEEKEKAEANGKVNGEEKKEEEGEKKDVEMKDAPVTNGEVKEGEEKVNGEEKKE
ncbi:thioredoxin-like protein [Podospora aff. communis PSN243]|uniref:thioredoxin-dependent peroxiredoxin n=1 Tax=Podospora aff. communis PSN243 TaxID=3040156 RepID=A0AAV9GNN3_9PEZI|nr:thioredoxin-like protein [Podospora aff. communis PSN243]